MITPFAERLTEWYLRSARPLPWKATNDPYKIWLSEVILQQTRVEQGLPYYHKFITLFPTVQDLANASEDVIMKAWEGLGYYSRARNLHATAKIIAEVGAFPETLEGWLALKGVGPYTARAVCSFAFGLPYAVLDGNVYRVISRVEHDFTPIDAPSAKNHFQMRADWWLGAVDSAIFNQAMMDLGATICTPKNPSCHICPLQDLCKAYANGTIDQLPAKSKTLKVETVHMDYYLIYDALGRFPIRKRTEDGIWKKLWELPGDIVPDFKLPPKTGKTIGMITHKLTHRQLKIRLSVAQVQKHADLAPSHNRLILFDEVGQYAFPKAILNLFDLIKDSPQSELF
jgi:A/G-specific adenine glycosylase